MERGRERGYSYVDPTLAALEWLHLGLIPAENEQCSHVWFRNKTNLYAKRYCENSCAIVMQERGVWKPWQQKATFDPYT